MNTLALNPISVFPNFCKKEKEALENFVGVLDHIQFLFRGFP
jgi:hypothetical protein